MRLIKNILSFKTLPIVTLFTFMPALAFSQVISDFSVGGVRIEFILFGLTLLGVALFHHHTLKVALTGLAAILIFKLVFTDFQIGAHLVHEWVILVNLFGLLIGFSILSKHFEESGVPHVLPKYLPDDWKGGFVLLIMVFIISSFLDNIAAAMIGGTIAFTVFKGRLHLGYLAAIVACSNAGGSGSVIGDTTTTMMWIDGIAITDVLKAYAGAIPVLIIVGIFASIQQDKFNRIIKDEIIKHQVDWGRLFIVAFILICTIVTNVLFDFPALGVWFAILAGAFFKKTDWKEAIKAIPGSVFLLSLVLSASMMPVEHLPAASWQGSLVLGFVSSVFDNIPLTKLALSQGGYDWGFLAFAVGYGGSMIWFGSSAGVALSNMYPETRSVGKWISQGWHVILAYVIGFFIMLWLVGWHPNPPHKKIHGDTSHQVHD
jgi:Na+/H+ antiporter NhaD/arsenite permease-like protein